MGRWSVVAGTLLGVLACVGLIESLSVFRGSRLIEYGAVFVLTAVLAWAARGAWRNAMVVVCSLVFGLIVIEALMPLLTRQGAGRAVGASFHDSGLTEPRPFLGWGPGRPGTFDVVKTNDEGRTIYDVKVSIDGSLNRLTHPAGDRPIAFFGDSFVFGDGVNDADTLPQAFADLNGGNIPVLNLAFSGWSPAQNLVALEQGLYRSVLTHPRHFILFTSAFHIERTACKDVWSKGTGPRFTLIDGQPEYRGPCTNPRWAPLVRFVRSFAFYRRIATYFAVPTPSDAETYRKIVETFVAKARDIYKVQTTILYEGTGDDYLTRSIGASDDDMVEQFRKDGLDVLVVDLPKIDDPSLYWIPGEGHPTALANRAKAKAIEGHLKIVDPAALAVSQSNVRCCGVATAKETGASAKR